MARGRKGRQVAFVADSVTPIERLIQRDRLWIALGLFIAIGIAWFYLVREAAAMNATLAAPRTHAAIVR
jgi:hypothetical protein